MTALPRITVFTTGGTIVSSGDSPTVLTGYSLTDHGAADLLASVPSLGDSARISTEAISNIDSMNMRSGIWVKLARRIEELAAAGEDGFVITHGTDTMEETAYFLHLVLKTDKPVVLTGAMRPASALSADGPINLLNAVHVAASPLAKGMGVLVAINDKIFTGRDVVKTDPTNCETFRRGQVGLIAGGEVSFFAKPLAKHTMETPFTIPELPLPRVSIVCSHADADGLLIEAAAAAGAKGIVHMGTGNGSIHEDAEPALIAAAKAGIIVVRASRASSGKVVPNYPRWEEEGFVSAGTLPAHKARILLQLALTKTRDPAVIAGYFRDF